jgi:hypothetical protein
VRGVLAEFFPAGQADANRNLRAPRICDASWTGTNSLRRF